MKSCKPVPGKSTRLAALILVAVWLVSGCSGSGESSESDPQSELADNESAGDPVTAEPTTTQVEFRITVPAYQSDALQVLIEWGEIGLTAVWNADELWTAAGEFPTGTENRLVITFYDRDGDIVLGRHEADFMTGSGDSEVFTVTADQFDTARWDDDGDGVSNLDESIAGTDPAGGDLPQPVQAELQLAPDKTFHITWQSSTNAEFHRVLENPDGISGFTDVSGELAAQANGFLHRVALYSRVNARYLVQSCNDHGCVDSEPVMVTGTLDNAVGYFKASNTGPDHRFGAAVSLSADGSTLAVGAGGEDGAATGIDGEQGGDSSRDSGAVYVFSRIDGLWEQQAYIKAGNAGRFDNFGVAVGLSGDGDTLVVGAADESGAATGIDGDQDGFALNSGAAYVFVRSDGTWQQQAYVKASNAERSDLFGRVVSLSADGNTLAVGAIGEDGAAIGVNGDQADNSSQNAGAVYVFVRGGGVWQQQAYIKASNTDNVEFPEPGYEFDNFGSAVSLSADGDTLVVAAEEEEGLATGVDGDQADNSGSRSGAVYVFVRSEGQWQQQAYVKASNTDSEDRFGSAVSLSADGDTLAVGALGEDSAATGIDGDQTDNSSKASGAAYVFVRSDGLWNQQAYLKASNADDEEVFGDAVSLSANGDTLAVGASGEDSSATGINGDESDDSSRFAGAAYVFVRSDGLWEQQAYVKKAGDTSLFDRFGDAVSLSADGDTLAVGAQGDNSAATGIDGDRNDTSAVDAGAVYLY